MGLHNRSQIFTGPHENVPESLIIPDTRAKTLLLHRTPWAPPLLLPSALTQLWWGTHPSSPAFYPVSFCLSVLPEGRIGLPCTCLSSIPNPCVPVPPHLAAGSGTGMYCRSFTSHQTHSFLPDLPYPGKRFKTLYFSFPDATQSRKANFCPLGWEMRKA